MMVRLFVKVSRASWDCLRTASTSFTPSRPETKMTRNASPIANAQALGRLPLMPLTSRLRGLRPPAPACYALEPHEKNSLLCTGRTALEQGRTARLALQTPASTGTENKGEVLMRVETQLSAFLDNRAGVLADLAADLGRHGICIRAL